MFPYRDENETLRTAIVTGIFIALNVLVWIVVQGAGSTGARPIRLQSWAHSRRVNQLTSGRDKLSDWRWVGLRYRSWPSGFAFSNFDVLAWFLDAFVGEYVVPVALRNNVEDSMGRLRFLVFYLLCGLAAALGQVVTNPSSAIPMVGASGAISGVMGAYLVLYPKVRVFALVFLGFFITSVALPAWMMLGYWLLIQFVSGLAAFGGDVGGVAFWAHVGGFVAGVVLVKLFARSDYIEARRGPSLAATEADAGLLISTRKFYRLHDQDRPLVSPYEEFTQKT